MAELKLRYKKEGVNIRVRRDVEDLVLTPKDVVEAHDGLSNNIQKFKTDLVNLAVQIDKAKLNQEEAEKGLKDIDKYYDSSYSAQLSLAKKLVKDVWDECVKAIEDSYKLDKVLSEEQNKRQMFSQLQRAIGTHPEVAKSLAPSIMQKVCFTECEFENPWLPKEA